MADLASRNVNYDEHDAPPHVTKGWHRDRVTVELGYEAPGEPEKGGVAETAGDLVNSYEFSDPRILRAAYKHPGDLVGRNMLLEGRFLFLRFLLGVRIVAAHDELVDGPNGPERLIGWSYATLDGHLEQGKLRYEIAKEIDTGRVEFRIIAYSRWSPIANKLVWAGFNLFGRRTQLTWYHHAMTRLQRLLNDPPETPKPDADGIVRAPSGAGPGRFEGFVVRFAHPGLDTRRPVERVGLFERVGRATPRPCGPSTTSPGSSAPRSSTSPAAAVRAVVTAVLRNRTVKDALHGVWLGHPLHPGAARDRRARSSPRRCSTRSAARSAAAGCRRASSSPQAWR